MIMKTNSVKKLKKLFGILEFEHEFPFFSFFRWIIGLQVAKKKKRKFLIEMLILLLCCHMHTHTETNMNKNFASFRFEFNGEHFHFRKRTAKNFLVKKIMIIWSLPLPLLYLLYLINFFFSKFKIQYSYWIFVDVFVFWKGILLEMRQYSSSYW